MAEFHAFADRFFHAREKSLPPIHRACLWLMGGLLLCAAGSAAAKPAILQAETGTPNPERAEVLAVKHFESGKGVALKSGLPSGAAPAAADLSFELPAGLPSRCVITTHAAVNDVGKKQIEAAKSKFDSIPFQLQIGGSLPTSRIVFSPWHKPESSRQRLGIFDIGPKDRSLKLWLPEGVILDRVEIHAYNPPQVPEEAANYRPAVVPPDSHPRLWVTEKTLPAVRANLKHPDHQGVWDKLRQRAEKPFEFQPAEEVQYNAPLSKAASEKALVYLLSGDEARGREAVRLTLDYLPRVEFGNILDITREIGATIYSAALVYDWCHALISDEEQTLLRQHMVRLAETMECGWPPFRGIVVNGHGNEAMINRDQLAMGIAIHGEDPTTYRYCAYRLLESLVPMRRFEYQSPRHNQGISYAAYRFGWEMHAALLFQRMSGTEVFDPNIKNLPYYWLHMRLPDTSMLRDGDGISRRNWRSPLTLLLSTAYSGNPMFKGEYLRQAKSPPDDILYLLLDDPALKAEPSRDSLPLTIDFGPVLGGMVARTGWNFEEGSKDVVAEVKGGGYHFNNHQHADAGALQVYYHGLQIADLGQYKFYGTPYDKHFNKRSISHSTLLVRDPKATFENSLDFDGGSIYRTGSPRSLERLLGDKRFRYGRVLDCDFGPDPLQPEISWFAADLSSAYPDETVKQFTRRFCFLNLGRDDIPAAMVVLDDVESSMARFHKYWQANTLTPPQRTKNGVRFQNETDGVVGQLDLQMVLPAADQRKLEILSGDDVHNVFGQQFSPPNPSQPEAKGHRVLFSPTQAKARDRFLVVMQACDPDHSPLEYQIAETEAGLSLSIADRVVHLPASEALVSKGFKLIVSGDGQERLVALVGLAPGNWAVLDAKGASVLETEVKPGKHGLTFRGRGGTYQAVPR